MIRGIRQVMKRCIILFVVLSIFSSFSLSAFAATVNKNFKHSDIVSNTSNGSTQHSGYSIAKTNGNTVNYTYTGDVFTSMSSLYDYKSDSELIGNQPNSIANGYTDPFTRFNTAISNDGTATVTSEAADNITFTYNGYRRGLSEMYVYLYDNDGHNNNWPGYMMYNQGNGVYKLTIPFSDIGFTPVNMIFSGKDTCGYWQTDDIQGLSYAGDISLTYSDYIKTASSNNMTFKLSKNDARALMLGGSNISDQSLHLREGTIKLNVYDDSSHSGIYNMTSNGTDWQVTFDASYLDSNFYVSFMSDAYYDGNNNQQWGNVETDSFAVEKGYDYTFAGKYNVAVGTSEDIVNNCKYDIPLYFGCFYRGNDASAYNIFNKPNYNSFWWQANISQRLDVSASIKGLVDNELHNDKLTQNGNILPYFNSAWVSEDNTRTGLMDSYENIWFPYYKMRATANELRGSTSETRGYAEFYQFNSKDTSLYFDGTTYTESNTAIHSQGTSTSPNGTVGFYPFNNTDNNTQLNLGFGARFDVSFRLSRDGKVETVDSRGKPTGDKINAMFEFIGDDDVWIYIDGKLVLDLGGCHKDATGLIDFADKKVYTNDLFTFDSSEDTLNRVTASSETSLTDIFAGTDMFIGNDYNEVKVHTLTLFYMERGMYESDLLIRFNFAVIPNENILKVVNLAKDNDSAFSDAVNQLLENSLFVYELENSGTHTLNVTDSEILYPTYDKYTHNGTDLYGGNPIDDTGGVYLNTSYDLDGNGKTWDSDGAIIGAYLWGGSQAAKTVLAEQVDEHLYRVDTEDYTNIHFMRIANGCTENFPYTGYLNTGNSGYWNRYELGGFTAGATYSINGWNSGAISSTVLRKIYPAQSYNFDTSSDKVANVSYRWVDSDGNLTEDIADGRTGLTGKTDSNGMFGMYAGSSKNESSVEFIGQFEKGSTIKIKQTNFVTANTTYSGTNLNNTSVKVSDIFERIGLTVRDNRGRDISTHRLENIGKDEGISFTFDNAVSIPDESVALTVYVTNELDVGNISFTKSTPGYTGNAECTFRIQLRNIFGVDTYDNLIDYSKLIASGNVSGTITIDSDGYFTTKANETVTFTNIPSLCEYKITETGCTDSNLYLNTSTITDWTSVGNAQEEYIDNTYQTWNADISKVVSGNRAPDSTDSFGVRIVITSADYDLTYFSIPSTVTTRTAHRIVASDTISTGAGIYITDLPPDAIVTVTETDAEDDPDFVAADSTTSVTLNKNNRQGVLQNVYNHINKYDLTIEKTISGDYSEFGIDSNTEFYIDVELDVNGTGASLDDIVISGADYNVVSSYSDYISFNACITSSDTLYIQNIPEGVNYTVSEEYSSRDNTDPSQSWYSESGTMNYSQTVNIYNHYTATDSFSLTITKELEGAPSDYEVDNDTTFDVTINLYSAGGGYGSGDEFNNISVDGVYGYASPSYDSCTITAGVSVNQPIVIRGIPQGAQYYIQESYQSNTNDALSTYEVDGELYSSTTETLVNHYDPANKLTVKKLLSGYYNQYNVDNYTDFKVRIQLTRGDSSFNNAVVDNGVPYDSFTASYYSLTLVANLSVAQDIILKNVPDSYTYTITEIDTASTGAIPYVLRNGSYVAGSTYSGTYTGHNLSVTFKNDFPDVNNRYSRITLTKTVGGEYQDYGVDTDTEFDVNIDLTYDGVLNNANIFGNIACSKAGYTVEDISDNNKQKVRINLGIAASDESVVITGVPFNTIMNLSEQGLHEWELTDDSVTSINDTVYVNSSYTLVNNYNAINSVKINKVLHDDDNILDNLIRTKYRTELYNRGKTKNDLVFPLLVVVTSNSSSLNILDISMNHGKWSGYTSASNNNFSRPPVNSVSDTNGDGICGIAYFTWYSVNEPLVIQGLPDGAHVEATELIGTLGKIYNLSKATGDADIYTMSSYTQTNINNALKSDLLAKYNYYMSETSVDMTIVDNYNGMLYMNNYFQNTVNSDGAFSISINKDLAGDYAEVGVDADTVFSVEIEVWGNHSFNYNNAVNIEALEYTVINSSDAYMYIVADISKNDNVIISGLYGDIEYKITEDTSGLALDSSNSITELTGVVNTNSSMQLVNNFTSFVPYVLPAAGMDSIWGILYGTAFLLFGCTIAYCYSSYKRRKEDV